MTSKEGAILPLSFEEENQLCLRAKECGRAEAVRELCQAKFPDEYAKRFTLGNWYHCPLYNRLRHWLVYFDKHGVHKKVTPIADDFKKTNVTAAEKRKIAVLAIETGSVAAAIKSWINTNIA